MSDVPVRVCSVCKTEYPATYENFTTVPRGKHGLSARCRSCANESSRKWAEENAEWHLDWQRAKRYELAEWVDLLKDRPCTDCGQSYPPYTMEWDHLPGQPKSFSIAVMVNRRMRRERILAEIEKCELVCANCHRSRTASRGTWGGRYGTQTRNQHMLTVSALRQAEETADSAGTPVLMQVLLDDRSYLVLRADDYFEIDR